MLNNVHEQYADLQAKVEEEKRIFEMYKASAERRITELEDEIRYRDGMKALESQIKPKEGK